jgi:hypothetical protein
MQEWVHTHHWPFLPLVSPSLAIRLQQTFCQQLPMTVEQNQDHGYFKKYKWNQLIAPYHSPSSGDDESIAIVRYTHPYRHSKEIVGNVGLNFNVSVSDST